MTPKVSVLVPAFNAERDISAPLRSALGQTMVDLEVVVVDDASADRTAAVVKALGKGDPRLRLFRLPVNKGPAAARNVGLSICRGEWIAPLDADDCFDHRRLERLLEHSDEADMVSDMLRLVSYPEGKVVGTAPPVGDLPINGIITAADYVRSNDFLRRDYSLGYMKPMIRRAFLDRHRLRYREELRVCEDYHLYLDCLLRGARWRVVTEPLYDYALRPGSLSRGLSEERFSAIVAASASAMRDGDLPESLRTLMEHRHRGLMRARRHAAFMRAIRAGRVGPAMRLAAVDPWLVARTATGAAHRLMSVISPSRQLGPDGRPLA